MFSLVVLICLLFAAAEPLHAATINVVAGSGTLSAAITSSSSGDTLVLADGLFTESSKLYINHALTLQAASGAAPVINVSDRTEVTASFTIKGISLTTKKASEGLRILPGDAPFDVTLQSCTLSGFSSRYVRLYDDSQDTPYVDHLTIDDCIFYLVSGARGVDASVADKQLNHLKITRSTFDGSTEGSHRMISVSASSSDTTIKSLLIDHCTFYHSAQARAVYLSHIDGAVVTNSIMMNPEEIEDHVGFCVYGDNSYMKNCISYQAPFYGSAGNRTACYLRNPRFVNHAAGNFTLCANSPAIGTATDGSNIGDPRWGVSSIIYDPSTDPYVPYKLPYTMAPTTSSVKVLWQMSEETEATEGVVRYGTDPDHLDKSKTSSDGWNVEEEGFVHIVTLTGLKPFTRYYFTVGDKTRHYPNISSTRTAPNPGTSFRIFSISDQHGHENWKNMQNVIRGVKADIALMNGDYVSSDGSERYWNKYFFTPGAPFLGEVPMMSSIGNHETGVPSTYRWSTYYDYFHQFSHGASLDPITDPRGEAFFHFEYGDVDVIMLNLNSDASSPDFVPGSFQYNWADSILASCTHPWTILCHHEGIYSTGYHGQAYSKNKKMAPLLEKYAAQGRHIISLSGDDHSFEHLYKDGVHYLRPGCGRDANYEQHKELIDYNYSLIYKQISCFSTFDVEPKKGRIRLTAYDIEGNSFYTYDFQLDNISSFSDSESSVHSQSQSVQSKAEMSGCQRVGQSALLLQLSVIISTVVVLFFH